MTWVKATWSLALVMGAVATIAACDDDTTSDPTGGSAGSGNDPEINGCTRGAAVDHKGEASVTITDESAWGIPHAACIVVDAGTDVVWEGVTSAHPLSGGEPGDPDDSSPISAAGEGDVTITLDDPGTYPYFCEFHLGDMQGVVYVE